MSAGWTKAPEHLEAIATEVHVWRIDLDASPQSNPTVLSATERRRAARLHASRVRQRWIAAHVTLRRILGRYLGADPAAVELGLGPRGKPILAEQPPRLHFNLSHSDDLALVAVTGDREVGIDVEREELRRDFRRLAEIGLEAEPAAAVRSAPASERAAVFYSAWVRHEAVVKCLGCGLGAPPPRLPTSVCVLDVGDGHAAALAVSGAGPLPVRSYSLPL